MAYEQKEGDIAIFKVKEKKSEKGPDWTGKALVDGQVKEISLWFKSDTMMAGTIKGKWKPDFQEAREAVQSTPTDHGEIPF
jgi:hypothetical protein